MTTKSDEYFDKLWKQYPTDLCQGKKGASKTARESWNKYFKKFGGFDEKEAERIIHLTKVGATHCRKDIKPDRWKFVSTYINQEVWADVLEWEGKPKQTSDNAKCENDRCNNEAYMRTRECVECLMKKNDPLKDVRKQALIDLKIYEKGDSLAEVARKCREYNKRTGKLETLISPKSSSKPHLSF